VFFRRPDPGSFFGDGCVRMYYPMSLRSTSAPIGSWRSASATSVRPRRARPRDRSNAPIMPMSEIAGVLLNAVVLDTSTPTSSG